ncbi:MAG: hypothetical protein K8H86_07100 [Ignavibacteriaceae bacterium]|nr:hypothetical protein [Ignavibacteriaceae bacterium]
MEKLFSLIFILLYTSALFCQEEMITIKFEVTTPLIDAKDTVFIAGNFENIGGWQPNLVPLEKQNDSLWTLEKKFPKGAAVEYKFTRGSWNTEAASKDGMIPGNNRIKAFLNSTVKHNITAWKDQFRTVNIGQITGTVEYLNNLTYKNLLPRNIIVWLPPNYNRDKGSSYPVLYMHDGQNVIDPATSSFGIDWQADETADSLILNGIIDPIIIVGINNTSNRAAEYSNNDTGRTYMEFIVKKLKPMIDSIYRTKTGREYTATCGSSMGGLISFMILWEYNDVFTKAISMSPAYKIWQYDYVTKVINDKKKRNIKLYIDNGGVGLETMLQPGITEMISALEKKGYAEEEEFIFVKANDAEHNEAAWAKRLPDALRFIFGK